MNLVEPREDIVPWGRVIYVADGETDVPAFEVVRRGGGFPVILRPNQVRGKHDEQTVQLHSIRPRRRQRVPI